MLTDQTITADDYDGSSNRREISEPNAKEWMFLDETRNSAGRSVTYYDIQSSSHTYKLDGSKIDKNIVEILFELK